jgi:hypothetical protein
LVDVHVIEAGEDYQLQAMVNGRDVEDVRLARDVSRIGLLADHRQEPLDVVVAALGDAIAEFA